MTLASDFADFVAKTDVLALAIALVLGLAVNDVINSLVDGCITPLVGLLLPVENLDDATFSIPNVWGTGEKQTFLYGALIGSVIKFLIIAVVLFLLFKLDTSIKAKIGAKKT